MQYWLHNTMSKSKFPGFFLGKSMPNLPTYSSPPNELDVKLQRAVENQNVKKVAALLSKKSVTPTKLGPLGKSVLHIACEIGNEQIVDMILQKTSDVNEPTLQGVTALQLAAAKGHTYTVKKLLQALASVDQRDCNDMTALHHACYELHVDCVRVLLSKNANPHSEEKGGKTPLFYAAHRGHVEICKWLLDKGADINHQDRVSVTPLMLAAKEGHFDVCELLLKRGANPSLTDREGLKAVEYAMVSGHPELQEVLDRAPIRDKGSTTPSESESQMNDPFDKIDTVGSSILSPSFGTRNAAAVSDDESASHTDVHSIHSMDDSLLPNREPTPVIGRPAIYLKAEQAYEVLKKEHEQLNENYSNLSSENLKLKDQVEYLHKKLAEKHEMENPELKEASQKQQLDGTVDLEKLHCENRLMTSELESLQQKVIALEEELEVAKSNVPTDAQSLVALLAGSRNFEEVNFDEEGFVDGQDLTKEEFLQAQNHQLKLQCSLLTEELGKLKTTFDAILKAGDNLQADYDQLAAEKDSLQDNLEVALKEKADIVNENEFLLTDNNDLHESLKKIVHELEKMQENYQRAQSENEELRRSVSVASKVGEVARLLEDRDSLEERCRELEETSQRLQHDHNILLEEVQSLNESITQLTSDRDQLTSDLDEIAQQLEALQLDYNQLELDFAELLKEKQELELVTNNNLQTGTGTVDLIALQKAYTEIQRQCSELKFENLEMKGLSTYNSAEENKLREQEKPVHEANSQVRDSLPGVPSETYKSDELRKQEEENNNLRKQIKKLNKDLEEWEKKHADTVNTYRTHLLSAVQGHMDPDVKDALYHIIELRSMEQFC